MDDVVIIANDSLLTRLQLISKLGLSDEYILMNHLKYCCIFTF